ncbi:MAG: tetratricopeptide repeat protein [Fimbriimonas sp.]
MRTCDRCQSAVPGDSRVCPECGAPLVPGARADIPQDVHRELARANLLRVRGEFDAAEAVCLSVLKRYPNSAPTHTLLGDIADDRGDLDQAERWYDLALDLDPESAGDRRKLEDVRARKNAFDSESTVAQIGLPSRPAIPWSNIVLGSLAALSFAGAAYVGFARRDTGRPAPTVTRAIDVPKEAITAQATEPVPEATPEPVADATPKIPTPGPTAFPGSQEDEAARSLLAQRSPVGSNLISAQNDPRAKVMTLTFGLRSTDDPRQVASELARTALELNLETQNVVVRGVRDARLVYVADVPRTRYADTLTDAWQQDNANVPGAFMGYVLTNEWNAPQQP